MMWTKNYLGGISIMKMTLTCHHIKFFNWKTIKTFQKLKQKYFMKN